MHTFRRAARTHHGMNACAAHGRRNSRSQVAIADQLDARARPANLVDQILVARPIQHDHYQVLDVAMQSLGDHPEIDRRRGIQIHRALAGRADHDFFHVAVRRVQ